LVSELGESEWSDGTARGDAAESGGSGGSARGGGMGRLGPGFSFSFSGQIPVFTGNGIPFRNFGEFRRISVDFGRNLLNFEF